MLVLGAYQSMFKAGENNIQNAKVLIEMVDSRFEHNGCDRCAGTQHGGALQLTLIDASYSTQSNVSVQINNVTFIGNCAEIGGAIYYLSHPGTPTSNSTMLFEGCMFIHNKAYIGSAVAMIPDQWGQRPRALCAQPTIKLYCRYHTEQHHRYNNTLEP